MSGHSASPAARSSGRLTPVTWPMSVLAWRVQGLDSGSLGLGFDLSRRVPSATFRLTSELSLTYPPRPEQNQTPEITISAQFVSEIRPASSDFAVGSASYLEIGDAASHIRSIHQRHGLLPQSRGLLLPRNRGSRRRTRSPRGGPRTTTRPTACSTACARPVSPRTPASGVQGLGIG
eukprot:3940655-Rhodomonas_salina.1